MKRVVSVWLPYWPLERMERAAPGSVPAEAPFALVTAGAKGLRITALNAVARTAGVHPGEALADARAAVPALITRPAEPRQDHAALRALAHWCGRYGPNRNVDGTDSLWIEVTGVAHLFGGEAALLTDITRRLAGFGITAHAAIAETLGAAFALARRLSSPPHRPSRSGAGIRPGAAREALTELPVEGLRLEPESVLLLKRLGLRRIGQLYAIPRSALARRFRELPGRAGDASGRTDQAVAVLTRLDQALGQVLEPLAPLSEPPFYAVRRAFADPLVSPEGIMAEAAALAAELCSTLDAASQGACGVRLTLYRADGTWAEVQAGTSRPCRQPAHILELLTDKLAALDAGFGIDVITLEATAVEPLGSSQTCLTELAQGSRQNPAALIDRLANRLGAGRVVRLAACESHVPERAQCVLPALTSRPPLDGPTAATTALAPRPALLLARPEPITVMAEVPEGPPARFTWRRLAHRVVKCEGPERIAPEWWRELRAAHPTRPRDYYRVEDPAGGRYWVFREGVFGAEDQVLPRWFLHAVFG